MTKGLDLRNHFSLTSSVLVNQICQDILKGIGITYFNYIKVFNDGSRELLTSNGDWIDHFYKNELYKTTAVIDVEYLIPKGYILWSELNVNEAAYSQGRESYNIDNGITLISKTVDSTSLFIFASTRNNDRINCFYQRNIDLLKRFILYFTDKGHDLLQVAAKNRIYLPDRQLIDEQRKSQLIISEEVRRDFFFTNKHR